MIDWWHDWKSLRALPYGGTDLMEQPAFVYQGIRVCEEELRTIQAEEHRTEMAKLDRQRQELNRARQ